MAVFSTVWYKVLYTAALLCSDWLFFLWHGMNMQPIRILENRCLLDEKEREKKKGGSKEN